MKRTYAALCALTLGFVTTGLVVADSAQAGGAFVVTGDAVSGGIPALTRYMLSSTNAGAAGGGDSSPVDAIQGSASNTRAAGGNVISRALNAFGAGPFASAPGSTEVHPPVASVHADTITYGQFGYVVGTAPPGAVVDLYGYTAPSNRTIFLHTVKASARGTYAFRIKPGCNTRMYVQLRDRQKSVPILQRVRARLSIKMDRLDEETFAFVGSVDPTKAEQPISLFRLTGNGDGVIARGVVDKNGHYSFIHHVPSGVSFYIYASTGDTDLSAGNKSTTGIANTYKAAPYRP